VETQPSKSSVDNQKPDGLAPDVRDRVERHLARLKSGRIAAEVRDKGMRPFMAGVEKRKTIETTKSQLERNSYLVSRG
jgi:hypothetical protein